MTFYKNKKARQQSGKFYNYFIKLIPPMTGNGFCSSFTTFIIPRMQKINIIRPNREESAIITQDKNGINISIPNIVSPITEVKNKTNA